VGAVLQSGISACSVEAGDFIHEIYEISGHKKRQVTYIAPLNHLSLLHSCPGEVQ